MFYHQKMVKHQREDGDQVPLGSDLKPKLCDVKGPVNGA